MDTALAVHRLQFAFTITFHYIFPQLTMGLALLLVVLKTMALRTGDDHYSHCARFWTKIFAITSESAVSFAIAYVVFMCRHFAGKVRLPEEGY